MIQTLYRKLGIAAHEKSRVKVAWFMRFLYQIGFVVSWTIVIALFVERFGIENLIFLFLAEACLFFMGSVFVSFFHQKIREDHYLVYKVILTLFFLFIASLFEKTQIEFFVFVIFAKDLFFSRINISLLRQTEEFFSPLEAQKFIPIIDSAITIGTIVGAFLMIELLKGFPEEAVLWLWGIVTALLGIVALSLPKTLNLLPSFEKEKAKVSKKNRIMVAFERTKNSPFLKNLLCIVLLQAVVFTFIEYEFTKELHEEILVEKYNEHPIEMKDLQASLFREAKEQILNISKVTQEKVSELSSNLIAHDKLAHDLGMFHLIFGIISLFVQFIITSRVLNYLGIAGAMVSYFLLLLTALVSVSLGYGGMNVLRGIQHGFHSIGTSAYHLVFYSFFSSCRDALRFFLEGFVAPLGVIISVGIIYFIPHEYKAYIMIGAILGLMVLGVFMKKNFTKHSAKITKSEKNIAAKIHHIEILGQRGHRDADFILEKELKNKKNCPIVREKVIFTLSRINNPHVINTYTELLNADTESLEMKECVLNALLKMDSLKGYWKDHAFSQHHLIEVLNDLFMKHDHGHIRKLIIMNIFQHIPEHKVVPFFLKEIKTQDEKQQSILLRSCSLFDDPAAVFYLRSFLTHSSSRIRGAAIITLWKFEERNVVMPLLEALLKSKEEECLISGLYAVGEIKESRFVSKIFKYLESSSANVRLHTLIALAKMGDLRSLPGLVALIFSEDKKIAESALHMMERVPEGIRYLLQKEIQLEVADRVFSILKVREVFRFEHLVSLPKNMILELKKLYRFAERYDDVLLLDEILNKKRWV